MEDTENSRDLQRTIGKGILSGSAVLAIAILLGRVSGLLRELLLASRFGLSAEADLAILLLSLPDLLVNLLVAGGLSAVLVPRLKKLSGAGAAFLFQKAAISSVSIFGSIALLFVAWPQVLLGVLAPGIAASAEVPCLAILCVALSIPTTAVAGVTGAYLNAQDRFLVAGLGTLIFNAAVIAGLFDIWALKGLQVLGVAVLIGATLRFASQAICLPKTVWLTNTAKTEKDVPFLPIFLAGIFSTTLVLVPPLIVRAVASLLGPGNVAAFSYSQKLIELPVGVLIATLSTVVLSKLSGQYKDRSWKVAQQTLHLGVQLSLLIACLCLIFAYPLLQSVISILFERGQIDAAGVEKITSLTQVSLLSLPFIAVNSILSASLYARERTTTVLKANFASTFLCALLTIPGFLTENVKLLMLSIVVSQAFLSVLLAAQAGLRLIGDVKIVKLEFIKPFIVGSATAMPIALAAWGLQAWSLPTAIGLAIVGFAASLFFAVKLMIRVEPVA